MKVSGIGANLYVAEFDLSGDVGSVETISSRRAMLEVPSLLNTGMERVAGLRDGEIRIPRRVPRIPRSRRCRRPTAS